MAVRGVLVESSLLEGSSSVEKLLFRLGLSNLHVGLLFTAGQNSTEKEELLKKWGLSDVVKVVAANTDEDVVEVINKAWPVQASQSVFVSPDDQDTVTKLAESGWNIIYSGQGGIIKEAPIIEQIDDLLAAVATLNKKACGERLLVVGHVMKWSREKDFLKRRALPALPTSNDLTFIALQTEKPLEPQLAVVDIVLHKATDEIVSVAMIQTSTPADRIQYSDGIQKLQRYLAANPDMCVVDPISRLTPLLDRSLTRDLLEDLEDAKVSETTVVRAPRSVEVKDLEEPHLTQAVSVGFPTIVKTMMACGTADAHTMAVVFKKEGYVNLQVPLPAVVQEYVDHGSCVYKFYIIGEKVYHSCRRSMPNAASLAVSGGSSVGLPALVFDSLKSMPSSFEGDGKPLENTVVEGDGSLDVEAVGKAAVWLRKKLGLTIIGFDIVVQVGTKDHVMVDVNYFPSFKDVSDKEALPAFWDALRSAHANKDGSVL
ncbi:hypothetical protein M758_4G103400 [Ceratodon purpureus]|nr:hypothetical protein M758_4G103400 [Ceratodon purpureus]KAG0618942.1 hypothetical protein M758_4G103400 [Ceratodon purpureus]KAG0618943.1 hypothetical protein M758_4G103400 [Ceratodon purpureus]KAG0618944.1 hypothetical protein M758_4G103400 [Ceratodon purpureus]KAG0618947.1 hypothetical protein M758_4G103400 [Ceratodon purpureus]